MKTYYGKIAVCHSFFNNVLRGSKDAVSYDNRKRIEQLLRNFLYLFFNKQLSKSIFMNLINATEVITATN